MLLRGSPSCYENAFGGLRRYIHRPEITISARVPLCLIGTKFFWSMDKPPYIVEWNILEIGRYVAKLLSITALPVDPQSDMHTWICATCASGSFRNWASIGVQLFRYLAPTSADSHTAWSYLLTSSLELPWSLLGYSICAGLPIRETCTLIKDFGLRFASNPQVPLTQSNLPDHPNLPLLSTWLRPPLETTTSKTRRPDTF